MNTFADINKYKNEMLSEQQAFARQEAQLYADTQAYAKEGTLPISAVPDNRTITEKLADMEYIKKTIVGELSQIADPQFALRIVEGILKSPLNVDGRLMRYAGNNIVEFVSQLKKKYGIGIRGDVNDVTRMVDFLNTLYLETSKTNQSVSDYIKSTSNLTIQNTMSKSNINTIYNELETVIASARTINEKEIVRELRKLLTTFRIIRDFMPTETQIQYITKYVNEKPIISDKARGVLDIITGFLEMLKKLPKPSIIMNLIDTINTCIYNVYELDRINDDVERRDKLQKEQYIKMQDAIDRINEYIKDFKDNSYLYKNFERMLDNVENENLKRYKDMVNETRRAEKERESYNKVYVTNMDELINALMGRPMSNNSSDYNIDEELEDDDEIINEYNYVRGLEQVAMGRGIKRHPPIPPQMQGTGIIRRPRGRPRGTSMKYKTLGINEFNEDKFNNGILAIRKSSNKKRIPNLPSKILTSNLKGIIKTISGGGLPTHNEIAKLDDEEKEYLYKIVKSSKIDRLDIPAPSKDKLEKLYHDFEVMKGQILAGNDNRKLVKDFKILVRKLSQMKMLPKADADDVIDLLLTLGY